MAPVGIGTTGLMCYDIAGGDMYDYAMILQQSFWQLHKPNICHVANKLFNVSAWAFHNNMDFLSQELCVMYSLACFIHLVKVCAP